MKAVRWVAACAMVAMLGACGVDREGTKKEMLEALSGTGLTDAQKNCVANSIDGYSDSELKKLDKLLQDDSKADDPMVTAFMEKVTSCATG